MRETTMPVAIVVEDEQRLRTLMLRELPYMGYEAVGASTAEEAQTLLQTCTPDVVLLDLHLPAMGGMELLAWLRAQEKGKSVPVIVMTGVGSLEIAQSAIRFGVVDFLTKPASLGEIEAALGRARRLAIETAQLPTSAQAAGLDAQPVEPGESLAEVEQRAILDAMARHDGNRTAAAEDLGISRRTLYSRLQSYGQA